MKRAAGNLYIRRLEIVDDTDQVIHKVRDVGVKKGFYEALRIVEQKDGRSTLKKIFIKFARDLDDKLKESLGMEDQK